MSEKTFKELTDYFHKVGAVDVAHSTKSYLAHAIGVYNDLKTWGLDEELARIGLFHSIYGTQLFQGFTLPLEQRAEVRELIGERAEWISFLNCALDRPHYDAEIQKESGPYQILNRFTGEIIDVSDEDFHVLCVVHLVDWLEQVARSQGWDYRRTAYRNLAKRLGEPGRTWYNRVFDNAPEPATPDEYDWPKAAAR